jgi:hypothetical protein
MICISNFKHTCKIPLHSCRDDGWHHVLSPSHAAAWLTRVCKGCS